jgi:hypothetical protein
MDERIILARFEKRNVRDPHDPTFDIVSQENEIVTMKYGGLAFLALRSGSRRLLRLFLDCHYKRRVVIEIDAKIGLRNGYITLIFKAIR